MKTLALASLAALALTAAACSKPPPAPAAPAVPVAAAPTSESDMQAALARHVIAVKAADVPGVLADYADNAILVAPPGTVTPSGTFVGKDKVKAFFDYLATPAVLPGPQSMAVTTEAVGPDTMLFRWTQFPGTPKEVKGSDVFVFHDGKIVFQTTAPLPKT